MATETPPAASTIANVPKVWIIEDMSNGLKKSTLTPADFCQVALFGDAKEMQFRPPRKAAMRYYAPTASETTTGNFYLTGSVPHVGDNVLDEKDQKHVFGFITRVVRQIPGSPLYEVAFEPTNDAEGEALRTNAGTSPLNVLLREFRLEQNPQCQMAASMPNVVATFVSERKDADTKIGEWLLRGASIVNGKETTENELVNDILSQPFEQEKRTVTWESYFQAAFSALRDDLYKGCNYDVINGRCVERVEKAMRELGGGVMPSYETYIANTEQFQKDLRLVLLPQEETFSGEEEVVIHTEEAPVEESTEEPVEEKNATPTMQAYTLQDVENLCAFFFVPEKDYAKWRRQERLLRTWFQTSKHECAATYLLRAHRRIFEAYLVQLNQLWQEAGTDAAHTAAVMWLLYYTQLPIFSLKLLSLMRIGLTRDPKNVVYQIQPLIKAFHAALVDHLSTWVPTPEHQDDDDVVSVEGCIHTYLESKTKMLVPVTEAVITSLGEPDC